MRHPFQSIPADKRPAVFWPLLLITLFLLVLLNMEGKPMVTPAAPLGIVSYELAGSVSRAQEILASWDQRAQLSAAFSLGLDYVFMLAYSTTIGLACVWTADALRRRGWPLASVGAPLAWGLWLAAAFDATENIALVVILFRDRPVTLAGSGALVCDLQVQPDLPGAGICFLRHGGFPGGETQEDLNRRWTRMNADKDF